jgi:type VI secretion system FHA domain protein
MRLTLRLSPEAPFPRGVPREVTLESGRMVIGRGPECGWILPDPERNISKLHCYVEVDEDGCRLTDTSGNGVYVNGSAQKIGKGNSTALSDGDRLALGRYEVFVEVDAGLAQRGVSADSDPFPNDPLKENAPQLRTPQIGNIFDRDEMDPVSPLAPQGRRQIIPDNIEKSIVGMPRPRISLEAMDRVEHPIPATNDQFTPPRIQRAEEPVAR